MKQTKKPLAIDLRPKHFDELLGHEEVTAAIRRQVRSGRMPTAWMLSGPPGAGKTSLSYIMAVSIAAGVKKFGYPISRHWRDLENGNLDVIEIQAAMYNKVEDITSLVVSSQYETLISDSGYRVIILDEAQRITPQAQQILLKPFEEKHSKTVWIICTSEPGKVSEAFSRRCLHYRLGYLKPPDLRRVLLHAGDALGARKTALIRLYKALRKLPNLTAGLVQNAAEIYVNSRSLQKALDVFRTSDVDTLKLCHCIMSGSWAKVLDELPRNGINLDEARAIRVLAANVFKNILTRTSDGPKAKTLADAILALHSTLTFDDSFLPAVITAEMYKITLSFKWVNSTKKDSDSDDDDVPF